MIRLALALLLLPAVAHAQTCKPPNVARVVNGLTMPLMQNALPYSPPALVLVCPPEGACHYETITPPTPPANVICLTPAENAQAESRYR